MSTRGRKAELRVIEGGGADDVPETVPAHIPTEMHGEWQTIVDELTARRIITEAMMGSVNAYVMAMFNARKAQVQIDTHGVLIADAKGVLKKNPAIGFLGKSQSEILRLSAELGLTPASSSRAKMKRSTNNDGDDDAQQDMFNGKPLLDF
ncbi:UNVERIFIED_ORG: P27 family predicted phage terminase small subunit [Agrobacterium larrymoorei]|nr:P27 family predicted phage terminase small subunit [Agrobacterium larrymoorei]